ncbi:OsmC family protein [Marinospirillum sp. MEB164]|uniref:OsmC family protein n=1 Tax=Marinospirillum alkalitolerans TaxID=3123374 RepID=A0ABW8PUG4_9GAMM
MSQSKTVRIDAQLQAGFAIHANINGHALVIDQPQAAQGTNQGPTPLEMFLFSIGGCIGTIARIAAFQQKIDLRGMQIQVEGDYNPAGLLGRPSDDRVGFQQIRIQATIDADLSDAEKAEFLDQVCHRCPLHDNISLETQVVHQLA